jgi:hypothetical protein
MSWSIPLILYALWYTFYLVPNTMIAGAEKHSCRQSSGGCYRSGQGRRGHRPWGIQSTARFYGKSQIWPCSQIQTHAPVHI